MRTVLCTGSRGWQDEGSIYDALVSIQQPFRIVVGDAKDGADPMFWMAAEVLDIPRLRFKARWKELGKRAGVVRNTAMLEFLLSLRAKGEEHLFGLAAWDGESRGTKNMMGQLEGAKFDVWRISYFGD